MALGLTTSNLFAHSPIVTAAQARPGESEITPDRLKGHVTFLADDTNEGRSSGRGTLEQVVTNYIESELTALGLLPFGDPAQNSFRQRFQVRSWGWAEMKKDHLHTDFTDPANFGHEPNEGGVALSPDGKIASVVPVEGRKAMLDAEALWTHNLVGVMEGSDPDLKNEYIVVGAHMDHIGMRTWGSGDMIYNGADDNGSGSSAILTMARGLAAAKQAGQGPSRSVVFMFFSGEELGLLGSQYWVSNPTIPLESIKAMLNIDMIGRLDPNQVSVFDNGSDGQPNLFHAMHDTSHTGLTSVNHDIENYLRRSDQYAFYKNGIPVIFFFEGFTPNHEMNPDYHGRGDHADKIEMTKLTDITRFVYRHLYAASSANQ